MGARASGMTSPTTCPRCGKEAEGSFCSWCGAALGVRHCNQCGTELEPGARFCNQCGAPLARGVAGAGVAGPGGGEGERRGGGREGWGSPGGSGRGGSSAGARGAGASSGGTDAGRLGWWIAGGSLVALILVVAYPVLQQDAVAPTGTMAPGAGSAPAEAPPGQGASAVDLSSMTPRDAADRLFNRVMQAAAAGDTAQMTGFLPMSIQAYERARPLDVDGLYHLALLQQTAGNHEAALATAREALEESPEHLLNLSVAAQTSHALGDDGAAREYYRTMLDAWDDELARGLPEYDAETAHGGMLPGIRREAEDFLAR